MTKINLSPKVKFALQIAIPVIIALLSFFVLTDWASSPEMHAETIASLESKQSTVMKLSATTMAASTAISLLPGDAATPIANEIAELSVYFIVIVCAIFLEKYLVTLTGLVAFKYLIPLACAVFIIATLMKNVSVKVISAKIVAFAIAIFLVIPFSVEVSDVIYDTYYERIEETITVAEETTDELSNSTEAEKKGIAGILDNLKGAVANIGDSVANLATNIEGQLNGFIEAIAIMLVACCAIPILVIFAFLWIIKIIFGFTVTIQQKE